MGSSVSRSTGPLIAFLLLLFWLVYRAGVDVDNFTFILPPLSATAVAGIGPINILRPPRAHVALASTFGAYHHDVLIPIGWSIQSVLDRYDTVKLYTETPYQLRYGFDEVINRTGIFHGPQEHHEDLVADMKSHNVFPNSPGAMIDMVVLGTCSFDLEHWSAPLLKVWDERPDEQKFMIVCVVHDSADQFKRPLTDIKQWALRGAIRYITLSQHVGKDFRDHLLEFGDSSKEEEYKALTEFVPVDVHVPVLPLPDPERPLGQRVLSRAVIQGLFEANRRDYDGISNDLLASIHNDPLAWGYLPLDKDEVQFQPDPESEVEPFQLHLVGGNGHIEFPPALSNVIKIHRHLDYWAYYELMQRMDIVIPAFSTDEYFRNKASSTVVMAVQCNVPLLVTSRFRDSYAHADDDRILITRPQALREVHAIKALRTGRWPAAAHRKHGRSARLLRTAVDTMLWRGWQRSNEDFASYKKELWAANEAVAHKLLYDL